MSDLVTKMASLEGADVAGDPIDWYKQRYGVEPDYSGLLNSIANSPTERSLLLRSHFEPTDDDHLFSEIRFNDLTSVLKSVG